MSQIDGGNLLAGIASGAPEEDIRTLVANDALRVERIVSTGQVSPPGFWYDQAQAELVVLISGSAVLRFERETAARHLAPGDWINIPAHCRHRVDWTDPKLPTVWLAIHYPGAGA